MVCPHKWYVPVGVLSPCVICPHRRYVPIGRVSLYVVGVGVWGKRTSGISSATLMYNAIFIIHNFIQQSPVHPVHKYFGYVSEWIHVPVESTLSIEEYEIHQPSKYISNVGCSRAQ